MIYPRYFQGGLSSMDLLQPTYVPNLKSLVHPGDKMLKFGCFGVIRNHSRLLEIAQFNTAHASTY